LWSWNKLVCSLSMGPRDNSSLDHQCPEMVGKGAQARCKTSQFYPLIPLPPPRVGPTGFPQGGNLNSRSIPGNWAAEPFLIYNVPLRSERSPSNRTGQVSRDSYWAPELAGHGARRGEARKTEWKCANSGKSLGVLTRKVCGKRNQRGKGAGGQG
jgi:hypothetical protein